eukprot:scaffold25640_cov146-Isochrysis_galbana.AAC.1
MKTLVSSSPSLRPLLVPLRLGVQRGARRQKQASKRDEHSPQLHDHLAHSSDARVGGPPKHPDGCGERCEQ